MWSARKPLTGINTPLTGIINKPLTLALSPFFTKSGEGLVDDANTVPRHSLARGEVR